MTTTAIAISAKTAGNVIITTIEGEGADIKTHATGTVKFFNQDKCLIFITAESGGKDVRSLAPLKRCVLSDPASAGPRVRNSGVRNVVRGEPTNS